MKCFLGFPEEISSISHSVLFLYFFALIAEEGFLISSYYLELCIQILYLFFSPLLFASLLFMQRTFHAKMGSIKDRNCMGLTEAEDIKKRRQANTEELYNKDFTTQIIMA